MLATDRVFSIRGNKIASMAIDEESIRFSSKSFNNIEDFNEVWSKRLSLATKVEVKFSKIKYVSKEEPGKEIKIRYKAIAEAVFTFNKPEDYRGFFTILEKEQYFTKTEETLSPIKAATPYIIGLFVMIATTIFCYYEAIKVSTKGGLAQELSEATDVKNELFLRLLHFVGEKGVIAIGAATCIYISYRIWKRYTNPPNRIKLLPPNA